MITIRIQIDRTSVRNALFRVAQKNTLCNMAERGRFELPKALRPCLISSQVHSTGLCHLSVCLSNLLSRTCSSWALYAFARRMPQCPCSPATERRSCCHNQSTGKGMAGAMPAKLPDLLFNHRRTTSVLFLLLRSRKHHLELVHESRRGCWLAGRRLGRGNRGGRSSRRGWGIDGHKFGLRFCSTF